MKRLKSILMEDMLLLTGLASVSISICIFIIFCIFDDRKLFTLFFLTYSTTVIYSTVLVVNGFLKSRRNTPRMHYLPILLVLWLISAFSLNQEMLVFSKSTLWLSIYLSIASLAIIATSIQEIFTIYIRHLIAFCLGAALILFAYYTIYLTPMYTLGLLGAIFLGISLHVFIPVLIVITIVISLKRSLKEIPSLKYSISAGIAIPLLISICFTFQWSNLNQKTSSLLNQQHLRENKLPEWVVLAQELPQSALTEKYLKTDLVYLTPKEDVNWLWGELTRVSFGEEKKHDPLVMIASFIIGKSDLDETSRIKILKSLYDSRHIAQERLWSGDNLETTGILSNIKVYPEYRMAYTEKTIRIKNSGTNEWNNNQEAIYTFHIPEGAVVSALSLWIEGVEEKARLTTKTKADSAYKTIVGVENRDPSVLHWQEGNTVSVRVFPCSNKEDRVFKIGISSPLKKENDQLIYENTWFDGPTAKSALENVQLEFSTSVKSLNTDLREQKDNHYSAERTYKDKWNLSFALTPLSNQAFSFAGNSYLMKDAKKENLPFKAKSIYIDLNSNWSQNEFRTVWSAIKDAEVYVYTDRLIRLHKGNLEESYEKLHKLNFSLFPFFEIKNPENALIITKGSDRSPNFSDLEGSQFQKNSSAFLSKAPPIYLYNLGQQSSPFLKTLKEFGTFRYSEGNIDLLVEQLQNNKFQTYQEKHEELTIPVAGVNIVKMDGAITHSAPDHLLRLYAYNKILHNMGANYFKNSDIPDELIQIADQAFIASPVSSLIVLESKKDYDRFDITESKNSLKNATFNSSGAAPEPHEWMLIILSAVVILYFSYRSGHLNPIRFLWK